MSTQAPTVQRFDTSKAAGNHSPELYAAGSIADPLPNLDAIDNEQIRRYHEQGFLAVQQAFPMKLIEDARQGIWDLVDGKDPSFHNIMFEKTTEGKIESMTVQERRNAVRKIHMDFISHEPRLKILSEYPPLTAVIQKLMNAVPKLAQHMALLKPPRIGREKPWHQDKAYFNYEVKAPVVGLWIGLDDSTPENGCMHVMPGSHKNGPQIHFARRDWQLCDTDILGKTCTSVPLPAGGCLLFDGLLYHGTPTNRSNQRRRSIQYHYLPEGTLKIEQEERLEHFGPEGKDVEC